jgi:hypothetical protein
MLKYTTVLAFSGLVLAFGLSVPLHPPIARGHHTDCKSPNGVDLGC